MGIKKIKQRVIKHLVNSTAMASVLNPSFCAIEMVAGMSFETSIHSRILSTALVYGGAGSLQDFSRRLFNIDTENKKVVKIHDGLYGFAYSLAVSPIFYYGCGSRNLKEIALGTILSAAASIPIGMASGYSMDAFKDLTGIRESTRVPNFIRRQSSGFKKGLVAITAAASIAATAAIYSAFNTFNQADFLRGKIAEYSQVQKSSEKDYMHGRNE